MTSFVRTVVRTQRSRLTSISTQPRRFAHSSYGNVQSGHEQGLNERNPKVHLEHPGPETPATQEQGEGQSQTSQAETSSNGSKPAIHSPKSAAEDHDPEVKKHNEEMRQRADRSHNQLKEDDNKVDKKFWKGDVGDITQKK